ncbi:MAG: helix-turn-helix domain-containing protein [Eubacterium sp.]|nr:helix-turn-helix domain-containing protein [Eubacterium sp.]
MNKYQFANYIYEQRKQLGLSQKELASMLGVTNKSVSKWETGAAIPRTNTLVQLAEVFNVSVDELFVEDEETKTPTVQIITASSLDDMMNEKLSAEKDKRKAEVKISKKEAKLYLWLLLAIFLVVFVLTFIIYAFVGNSLEPVVTVEQGSMLDNLQFSLVLAVWISGIYTGIVAFARLLKRIPIAATVIMVLFFPITIVLIMSFGICLIIPISIKCIKVIKEDNNG